MAYHTDWVSRAEFEALEQNDPISILKQISTNYTVIHSDHFRRILRSISSSAIAVTIPEHTQVPIPVGATLTIEQAGTGQVTVVAGSGVTINHSSFLTNKSNGQFSVIQLLKTGTNTWTLFGGLEAA